MFREQAGVAGGGGIAQIKYCDLSVEAHGCARYQWFALTHAGAVYCMPGGEVVAAVEHDISFRHCCFEHFASQSKR